MRRPKRDPVREDRIHNESHRRCRSGRAGIELVLLSGKQNQLSVSGQVCRRERRLAAPQR